MRFVVVTGMSGGGKSTALKMLEDAGFYCVDNLPVSLIEKFVELISLPNSEISKVVLGLDVRSDQSFEEATKILQELKRKGYPLEILFMDAGEDRLIKRYKETRRSHPLAGRERLDRGIAKEREKLAFLKKRAGYILDTSQLLTRELKAELDRIFLDHESFSNLFVTVLSFGFKYGIPTDADLVFDVRFLPNPYYVETLRSHTGNDSDVQEYVKQGGIADEFMEKLYGMIDFLLPYYVKEGKNQLVIAVGCTGGKHRSVTIANLLYERLTANRSIGLKIEHRDIENDSRSKK